MRDKSLPPREAWIEIRAKGKRGEREWGRFPRGKRGLKFLTGRHSTLLKNVASPAGSVD